MISKTGRNENNDDDDVAMSLVKRGLEPFLAGISPLSTFLLANGRWRHLVAKFATKGRLCSQKWMNFRKTSKGGGGISDPKNFVADFFGNFEGKKR